LGGLLLLAGALAGCQRDRTIAVRVSIPSLDSSESPAAGVGVVALPYDRDSVLASMAQRARTPKPNTARLDSLFASFRGPFLSYTALSYTAGILRDSVEALRGRLTTTDHRSAEYRQESEQLRQLSDSLARMEARLHRARETLDRSRQQFVRESDSLRSIVRHWEDSTYQGYDSVVEQLTRNRGQEPSTDTTDATGWAHFRLRPGRWWLYAQAWDTSDPNAEWYWNLPLDSDTMLLSSRTGKRRPKY